MVRILSERPDHQPSPFAIMLVALAAITLGILFWAMVQSLVADYSDDIPFPRPRPVHTSPLMLDLPMTRSVKTIPVGPDPLAEPDPLKPYRGKPE